MLLHHNFRQRIRVPTMSGSLYLFPCDIHAAPPDVEKLRDFLLASGFIGDTLSTDTFLGGTNLLAQVIFAGCSPHLAFTPPDDGSVDFCHIAIHGPYRRPRMITGPHTQRPRCPNCQRRARDWRALQTVWHTTEQLAPFTCPNCAVASAIDQWRWRRHSVFGRLLIAVRGVFPGEAVPSDTLVLELNRATGTEWDYGWAATVSDV